MQKEAQPPNQRQRAKVVAERPGDGEMRNSFREMKETEYEEQEAVEAVKQMIGRKDENPYDC